MVDGEEKIEEIEKDQNPKNKKSNVINHINGNVVHVTVNNFITS